MDYAVNHKLKGDVKRLDLTSKAEAIHHIELWMGNPVNQDFIRDSILSKMDANGDRKAGIHEPRHKNRVNL